MRHHVQHRLLINWRYVNVCAEIVARVQMGERPYMRPSLVVDADADQDGCCHELASLINRCWSEEPSERPDFHTLKIPMLKRNNIRYTNTHTHTHTHTRTHAGTQTQARTHRHTHIQRQSYKQTDRQIERRISWKSTLRF